MRSCAGILVAISALLAQGCGRLERLSSFGGETVVGSGHLVTKPFDLSDFDALDVQGPFAVEIHQGQSFQVTLTADDNLFEHIRVTKQGDALRIALAPGKNVRTDKRLQASVTMPRLEQARFSGATEAMLTAFKSDSDLRARCSGASTLKGTVEAGRLTLEADGASTIKLGGAAREGKLTASGASRLDLAGLKLDRATVDVSGASRATVDARQALDYVASGASRVTYEGEPEIGRHDTSGASSAVHR